MTFFRSERESAKANESCCANGNESQDAFARAERRGRRNRTGMLCGSYFNQRIGLPFFPLFPFKRSKTSVQVKKSISAEKHSFVRQKEEKNEGSSKK